MNIEKNGNKWRIRMMHKGVKYSLSLDYKPTKKEAERLIYEKIAEEGTDIALNGTFSFYANKYIEAKKSVLKSPTIVKYKSMVSNMPQWFLEKDFKAITQEDVQILVSEHSETHSAKTTKDLHGFVASVFGLYRPSLTLRTTLPTSVKKKDEYEPTDEDIKAILERAKGTRYEIIFNLLVYGLRRSEALAIDISTDLVDRKEKTTTLIINKAKVIGEDGQYYIRQSNKTEESTRRIEISNALADIMTAQGTVFDAPPHMLNKALRRYQDQLGIEHFNLHKFRHYYASMMLSLGVPITFVESSGGWKHGSTALRDAYTYTQEQKLKKEQEKGVEYLSKLLD